MKLESMQTIEELYKSLYKKYGPQNWWPCEGEKYGNEEIAIGAILTQNTSWKNVERALQNLREYGLLSLSSICDEEKEIIAQLIKPAGFYNQKTLHLKNFSTYVVFNYGTLKRFFESSNDVYLLRKELLYIKGIGRETADSILLYAGFKRIFVVDKYTFRIFKIYGLLDKDEKFDYEKIRQRVEREIKKVNDLQEFHALIVEEGKRLNSFNM